MDLTMIGQAIKDARKLEGLTQEELAVKMETTKSVISEIENGKRNIGVETLIKLAAVLDCDLSFKKNKRE
jgi:transcriptional regulator with XRE-family HTH domain